MYNKYNFVVLLLDYSQLSPCGHPAIADTRYYGQNPDPRRIRFDWKWLPLLRTLAKTDTKRRPERVRYNESWLYNVLKFLLKQ